MRSPLIEAACAFRLSLDAAGRAGAENMAIDAELLDRADGTGASVLLRDSGRRRGTRRRSQAGGLGTGPEEKCILAAWVDPARWLAGDRCSRKPHTTSRKCGDHAFRGVGTTRDVVRSGRGGRAGVA